MPKGIAPCQPLTFKVLWMISGRGINFKCTNVHRQWQIKKAPRRGSLPMTYQKRIMNKIKGTDGTSNNHFLVRLLIKRDQRALTKQQARELVRVFD